MEGLLDCWALFPSTTLQNSFTTTLINDCLTVSVLEIKLSTTVFMYVTKMKFRTNFKSVVSHTFPVPSHLLFVSSLEDHHKTSTGLSFVATIKYKCLLFSVNSVIPSLS